MRTIVLLFAAGSLGLAPAAWAAESGTPAADPENDRPSAGHVTNSPGPKDAKGTPGASLETGASRTEKSDSAKPGEAGSTGPRK